MKMCFDWCLGEEIKPDSAVVTSADMEDHHQKYEILAIGPGRYDSGIFIEPPVKKGDIVIIMKHGESDTNQELKDKGQAVFMSSRIIGVEK